MAITPKCLVEPVFLTTADVQYYVASKGITIIDKLTVYNVSALYQTLNINLVASGGASSTTNRIVGVFTIAPGETYEFTKIEGHILNTGDSIHSLASANSALSLRVSGREVMI